MERNENSIRPESATDEPGSCPKPPHPAGRPPNTPETPAFVEPLISDCLNETFDPGARKPRSDGWTAEKIGGFLRALAVSGVVENAADAVGMSAAGAYALRNRRQGRAFARMWDAILIHRTRARLAGEIQGRALNGCVSLRKRDGAVVGEYHFYDNRLAMAMLTRMDKLAEREAPSDAHLRALAEDMEAFIDCVAEGGDTDGFVAARDPSAQPPPSPPTDEEEDEDEIRRLADYAGCPDYLDVHPHEIDVSDLDPSRRESWGMDGWLRGFRSGYLSWLAVARRDPGFTPGPGTPLQFSAGLNGALCAVEANGGEPEGKPGSLLALRQEGRGSEIDASDLDPWQMDAWSDEQWARAWCSGFLERLRFEFWNDLARSDDADEGGR